MSSIDFFRTCISGDFDNAAQVEVQRSAGLQIHPYAMHINRVFDTRMKHAPYTKGFWILEESYYVPPGSNKVDIKPYLFLFEPEGKDQIKLTPYTLPPGLEPPSVRNDRDDLSIDFLEIRPSPTFKPAFYTRKGNQFTLHAPNDLPGGMRFTLIETIDAQRLEVMELLEKDGKRLTPYATPILYDRKSGLKPPR